MRFRNPRQAHRAGRSSKLFSLAPQVFAAHFIDGAIASSNRANPARAESLALGAKSFLIDETRYWGIESDLQIGSHQWG
jgi:hypothetical protein